MLADFVWGDNFKGGTLNAMTPGFVREGRVPPASALSIDCKNLASLKKIHLRKMRTVVYVNKLLYKLL